ncbi:hypothetical protein NMG60_11024014 [Bertholletia excelsa]
MVSSMKSCWKVVALAFFITCLHFLSGSCVEFDVGGKKGWAIPASKNESDFYNDWASKNRFKVNDTLRFEYKEDSVLEVSEEEYEKCKSSHPSFFSNSGDTSFQLDRPGLFYFISGVAGHCPRGQKMIVKVLELPTPPSPPPQSSSDSDTSSASSHNTHAFGSATLILLLTLPFAAPLNFV